MDCSNIRTVRVHKEQFDAIENKADVVIITCIEDGRSISFNREKNEEVTSEEKSIFDNKVVFNNNSIKVNGISLDRFSVTDAQGSLLGPLSFTITGDNTFKVLSISSCSLSVSGNGTLKFVPSAFGEEGIITDVEQQKVFVSSKVKTSLPITYEDGYVFINKKVVEKPSEEPSK